MKQGQESVFVMKHTHTQKTSVGHFQDNGEVVMHEGSIQYGYLGPVYISSPVTTDFNAAS